MIDGYNAIPLGLGLCGWLVVENKYDHLGNLVNQSFGSVASGTKDFTQRYTYDAQARLDEVYTNAATTPALKYYYNVADNIIKAEYYTYNGTVKEEINYKYDYDDGAILIKRGFLKEITNKIGTTEELRFKEALNYTSNGNISMQTIENKGISAYTGYTYAFEYDDMNRLKKADISPETMDIYKAEYLYNKDGAFTSKKYNGDEITYNYPLTSHKLNSVKVVKGGITRDNLEMNYDEKGNLTTDGEAGITISNYDHRNLPLLMEKGTEKYYYSYNDNGARIKKVKTVTEAGVEVENKTEYYLNDHTGRTLAIYEIENGGILKIKSANICPPAGCNSSLFR
jgi:hypothetical protein